MAVKSDVEKINEFWLCDPMALFRSKTISLVICMSLDRLKKDRKSVDGIPHTAIGKIILYRKSDVLKWLYEYGLRD